MRTVESSGRFIQVLYFAHLAVPSLLVLDVLLNWRRGGRESLLVLSGAGIWVMAGLCLPYLRPGWTQLPQKLSSPLTSIYAIYSTLLILELALRTMPMVVDRAPTLYPPGYKMIVEPATKVAPGIQRRAMFTVNEVGLRGPSLPRVGNFYKIVTIGGSTTECLYLDDSKEWPHLVMEDMNYLQAKRPIWVANAGVSGKTTVDHLMLMRTLPVVRRADLLVFMIGANDLMASLAYEGSSTQQILEEEAEKFRESLPNVTMPRYPLFRRLEVYRLAHKAADTLFSRGGVFRHRQHYGGTDFGKFRHERAIAAVVSLPDLQLALKEYSARILEIQAECRGLGLRCLFTTQPSMWRADLGAAEKELLWFGWVGRRPNPRGYLDVADASRAIDAFNQRLKEVCNRESLECIDLAPLVPKDTTAFFDDFHFNEGGARIVAQLVAHYLLSMPPFEEERSSSSASVPRH